MARTTDSTTIVILDDELFSIEWLFEYLSAKGFHTLPSSNAGEAISIISKEIYRALIIDLNVPIPPEISEAASKIGNVYKKYPGLFVAKQARNMGYRDRQVIIYSVHRDPEVAAEAARIGCAYILKGRPTSLKAEILSVLDYDPTVPQTLESS